MKSTISRRNLLKSCLSMAMFPAFPASFFLPAPAMGYETASAELIRNNLIGFHGQLMDPVLGIYRYGNGYRLYNPYLRRFQQFDIEMAPFGAAGTNGYLFVSNDPFNRIDPDGRLDQLGLAGGILSIIFAIAAFVATVVSGGLAAPTLGAALSTTTFLSGLISGSTGIAAAVIDDPSHPAYRRLSRASAWSGLIVDVASVSVGGVGVMKAGTKVMNLTSKARPILGFSTKNMLKQISKAKWISKVEMGLETLDTVGTSMGLAASYKGDSTLAQVGIGFNIGANVGKLPFYSRMPARILASKVAGTRKSVDFISDEVGLLGKKLGSVSDEQIAVAKAGKETIRGARIARNIVKRVRMATSAPTSMLNTGITGPASINSEITSQIMTVGDLDTDLQRHEQWQGVESGVYGYGLEYLN